MIPLPMQTTKLGSEGTKNGGELYSNQAHVRRWAEGKKTNAESTTCRRHDLMATCRWVAEVKLIYTHHWHQAIKDEELPRCECPNHDATRCEPCGAKFHESNL